MRRAVLLVLFIFFPAFAYATVLININTANAVLLDDLPGIGPSKATAIVDYRNGHGPFVRIEDIQNVSGIGTSTYEGLKAFITVGVTSVPNTTASSTSDTATTALETTSAFGLSDTYVPPPSSIAVKMSGTRKGFMEVPMTLSARATSKGGAVDSSAQIVWSFGDGSSATGIEVTKTYHYAGTYVVTVIANNGMAKARDEMIVSVTPALVRIISASSEGIMIVNDSDERLDLSQWRLSSSMGSFRIPEGTTILSEASVLFPSAITNLPIAFDATLSYPDGVVAARFVPIVPVPQPSVELASSNQQAARLDEASARQVEQIISPKTPAELYENKAVIAPAATPDTGVAAGAVASAQPALAAVATAPEAPKSAAGGLFRSVWTLGLLGVIALAGGAFILL